MIDLKLIASALKEAGRADLQVQILELSEKLREKEQHVRQVEHELRSLRDASDLRARIRVHDELYFVQREDDTEDGPFCTRCFDVNQKLVRLQVAGWLQPICPECKVPQGPRKKQEASRSAQTSHFGRRGRLNKLYGEGGI